MLFSNLPTPTKLDKVLYGYGMFVCDEKTFYSPLLFEVMKPFEDRRARIDAYKRNKKMPNRWKSATRQLQATT